MVACSAADDDDDDVAANMMRPTLKMKRSLWLEMHFVHELGYKSCTLGSRTGHVINLSLL